MTPIAALSVNQQVVDRSLVVRNGGQVVREPPPVSVVPNTSRRDGQIPVIGPRGIEKLVKSNADDERADLSPEERRLVAEMAARDREVRNQEIAQTVLGGRYAGAPVFEYATGPDGKRYVVSGSIEIDSSPVRGDPEATIAKMERVKAAALAAGEPSGTDKQVAARAEALRQEALAEMNAKRIEAIFNARKAEPEGEARPAPESEIILKEEDVEFEPWFVSAVEEILPFVGAEPMKPGAEKVDVRT